MPRVRIQEMAQDPNYAITNITEEIKNNTDTKLTGLNTQLIDGVQSLNDKIDENYKDLHTQIVKVDNDASARYVDLLDKLDTTKIKLTNTKLYLTIMNIISLLLILFLLVKEYL